MIKITINNLSTFNEVARILESCRLCAIADAQTARLCHEAETAPAGRRQSTWDGEMISLEQWKKDYESYVLQRNVLWRRWENSGWSNDEELAALWERYERIVTDVPRELKQFLAEKKDMASRLIPRPASGSGFRRRRCRSGTPTESIQRRQMKITTRQCSW
jgi:hypothetical protein